MKQYDLTIIKKEKEIITINYNSVVLQNKSYSINSALRRLLRTSDVLKENYL